MKVNSIEEFIKLYKEGKSISELELDNQQKTELFEYLSLHKEENDDYLCLYGTCFYNGWGVSQDYTEAVSWYRKSAEQGNAEAQCHLGYCYVKGQGVPQDYNEAVKWFRKSAEQGYAIAQLMLADCYYEGHGILQDYNEAVNWYRKSAEQGNARAQCNLGSCYYNGHGVEKDYNEAVNWFRKSAEQGNARAQCNLGYCYEEGQGVERDYDKALEYFEMSAEQNFMLAFKALSALYAIPTTRFRDLGKSMFYEYLANGNSRAVAYYNVAFRYYTDENISHNKYFRYGKALEYINKAYELGLGYAKELKDKIEELYYKVSLTTSEIKKELRVGKSKDVFISWNHNDLDIKNKIRDFIIDNNFSCWDSDVNCHGDIQKACREGVLDSSLFLVIISGNTLESNYVAEEIEIMLDRISITPYLDLKKCVMPIFINRYVNKKGKIKKFDVCKEILKLSKKNVDNPFVKLLSKFGSSFVKSIEEFDFNGVLEFMNGGLQILKIREYTDAYLKRVDVFEGALENTFLSEQMVSGAFSTTFTFEDAYVEQPLYKDNLVVNQGDVLKSNQPILIYGEGGIGKSLYLKNLTRKNFSGNSFFFYLSSKEIISYGVKTFYEVLYKNFEAYLLREVHTDCIRTILEHNASYNDIFIIIDALDEISDFEKKTVLQMIYEFSNQFKNIHYIFSSRNSEDANFISSKLKMETLAYHLKGLSKEDMGRLYDYIFNKAKCTQDKTKFLNLLDTIDDSIRKNSMIISNLIIIYLMSGNLPTKLYEIIECMITIVFENLEKDRDASFEYGEYFKENSKELIEILEYVSYMRSTTNTMSTVNLLQNFFSKHEVFKEDKRVAVSVDRYLRRRGILKEGDLNHQIYRDYFSSTYCYNRMYKEGGDEASSYLEYITTTFTIERLLENIASYGEQWYSIILYFILKIDSICYRLGKNNKVNEKILRDLFEICLMNTEIRSILMKQNKSKQIYHSKLLDLELKNNS